MTLLERLPFAPARALSTLPLAGDGDAGDTLTVALSSLPPEDGSWWKYAPRTTSVTGMEQLPALAKKPLTG